MKCVSLLFLLLSIFNLYAEEKPPFAVGSKTIFIQDPTRGIDPVGGIEKGVRVIPSEVWYPVDWENVLSSTPKAKISAYFFGSVNCFKNVMTQTNGYEVKSSLYKASTTVPIYYSELWNLFTAERKSYINAPLSLKGHFPLIICSPGLDNTRMNAQILAEHLASRGYIVVACEHTGVSPACQLGFDPKPPEGNDKLINLDLFGNYAATFNPNSALKAFLTNNDTNQGMKFIECAEQIRLDLQAVYQHFSKLNNETGGLYCDRLDFSKVGLLAYGSSTLPARAALTTIKGIKAGAFIIPQCCPSFATLNEKFPALQFNESLLWLNEHEQTVEKKAAMYFFAGEDPQAHMINTLYHSANLDILPTEDIPHPELDRALKNAKSSFLLCTLSNTIPDSFFYNSPCNLMPSISENEFSKVFKPTERFTLLKQAKVDEITKDKTTHFFDIYIRGDIHLRKSLIDQKYQSSGLIMQYRYITTTPKN